MALLKQNPARPHQLKTRTGGVLVSTIGVVALSLGLAIATMHIYFPDVEISLVGRIIASLFLVVVGALFLFVRNPCFIDRRKGVIQDETMFSFMTLKSTETSLDDFTEVEIRKEVRRSDKKTYTVYPVRLKGEKSRDFGSSQKYEESRQLGEQIAQFLEMPLIDYSSGEGVRREHNQLNESLSDQLRRLAVQVDVPPEPSLEGLVVSESPAELTLEIPKGARNMLMIIMVLVMPLIMLSFFVPMGAGMMTDKGPPPIFLAFAGLIFLIPILVVLVTAWRNMPASQTVKITPKTVTIVEKRPLLKKTTLLQTAEVEELVNLKRPEAMKKSPLASFSPNRGLSFRTDTRSVEIAKGMNDLVKTYLDARIRRYLMENG